MNRLLLRLSCAMFAVAIAASPTAAVEFSRVDWRDRNAKNLTFNDVGQPTPTTPSPPLGTRTGCLQQLIAVSPKLEDIEIEPGDCRFLAQDTATLTVSEFPTFWFYVPEQLGGVSAEFELLGEGRRSLVREQVTLGGGAGLIAVRLSYPLEADRSYRWQFRVDVNPRSPSENPRVGGTIQRMTPDAELSAQLAAASPQEQIALYAANGIWHETLTLLADLRRSEPNNPELSADWSSLLSSVRLGAIANTPILNCCTSQPAAD